MKFEVCISDNYLKIISYYKDIFFIIKKQVFSKHLYRETTSIVVFIVILGLHIGLHKCPKTTLKRPKTTQKKRSPYW